MKALPLWQPWATLVALGAKQVETRHWAAPRGLAGQRIAIHATKTQDGMAYCVVPRIERALGSEDLSFGAVVATVVLDHCELMTPELIEAQSADERAFGDWRPGRYAWFLRDVERLADPVPVTGRQGIFDVPDELLGYRPRQEGLL